MSAPTPAQLAGTSRLSVDRPRAEHDPLRVVDRTPRETAPTVVLPPLTGAPVREIRKRLARFTAVLIIDDSCSMYGFFWGDELSGRYAAARSLLELLRRSGPCSLGAVHYGDTAPASLALEPRNIATDHDVVLRALSAPEPLGGTNVAAALERSRIIAPPPAESTATAAYLVVSDGIEPVTAAIEAAVERLGAARVHLLLVDRAGGCTPQMEAAWRALQLGSLTRLKTFDPKLMAEQLAGVAASTLGLKTTTD